MAFATLLLCAALAAPVAGTKVGAAVRLQIDPAASRVDFDIVALWVLRRRGRFDEIQGVLSVDRSAHEAQIDIHIPVRSVWMKDPEHRALLLSPAFFDADQHPEIRFRSDVFSSTASGELQVRGTLSVRGRERRTRFSVRAEGCTLDQRPEDCHVHVRGTIRRSRFGMVEYSRTLADEVHLDIEVRLSPPVP